LETLSYDSGQELFLKIRRSPSKMCILHPKRTGYPVSKVIRAWKVIQVSTTEIAKFFIFNHQSLKFGKWMRVTTKSAWVEIYPRGFHAYKTQRAACGVVDFELFRFKQYRAGWVEVAVPVKIRSVHTEGKQNNPHDAYVAHYLYISKNVKVYAESGREVGRLVNGILRLKQK
jgi:hypothetical protein